jgi:CBS domain-containing protein
MSENLNNFRSYYNKIDSFLEEESSNDYHNGFKDKINQASKNNVLVRKHSDDLNELRELRNTIIHESKDEQEWIAIPTESTVEKIKNIYQELTQPATAYDIATTDLYTASPEDKITDVIQKMKENVYTHVPITSEKGNLVGILSEPAIIEWLADSEADDQSGFILEETEIKDISSYLDDVAEEKEYHDYKIVARSDFAIKAEQMFRKGVKSRHRLGAVFVTQNGELGESLLGIITSWDLAKI